MAFPGAHSSVFEGCGFCRQPAAFLPLCRTLRFSQPRLGGQCSPQLSANPRPAFRSAGVSPALLFWNSMDGFSGCHTLRFLKGAGFVVNPSPPSGYPAPRNCRLIISFAVAFASPRCTIHANWEVCSEDKIRGVVRSLAGRRCVRDGKSRSRAKIASGQSNVAASHR